MPENDMANGEEVRHYQDAQTAAQGERISNLNRRQTDFEAESRANFRAMESSLAAITTEMRQSFSNITSTLAERNKPQWQALSVMLVFVGMVGALAYMPIREATNDLKADMSSLSVEARRSFDLVAERFVSRQEMDWRAARGAEDRERTDASISDLRNITVTRSEWSERNRARDQEVADLSRRIEEIRAILGSQYTTRDVLLELQEEVKELRRRARSRASSPD